MSLLLAPMEGLLDHALRDVITRIGGVDRCVSEFVRVTDRLLPERVFLRVVPELAAGGRTPAGVPVRVQLLDAKGKGSELRARCTNGVIDGQVQAK